MHRGDHHAYQVDTEDCVDAAFSRIVAAVDEALESEIRCATVPEECLGPGTRVRVTAAGAEYRFQLVRPIEVPPGSPTTLSVGELSAPCTVVAAGERQITLELPDDVGKVLAGNGALALDAPWLTERLRFRVQQALLEAGPHTKSLVLQILGQERVPDPDPESRELQFSDGQTPLTEEQLHALKLALRSGLSIVAAPAGTGKTVLAGALIEAAVGLGYRVLVVAPSNQAVDLDVLQACERGIHEPTRHEIPLVRLGSGSQPAFRERFGAVLVGEIARTRHPHVAGELDAARCVADETAAELQRAYLGRAAGGHMAELQRALTSARDRLKVASRSFRDCCRQVAREARVVACTLAQLAIEDDPGAFDLVIIDEASMASVPAVLLGATMARRHLVLLGDPYQLPPVVRSRESAARLLRQDVFQTLQIGAAMRDGLLPSFVGALTEQHRYARPICDLMEVWYGPSLRTSALVVRRERELHTAIFGTQALCWFDTSSLNASTHAPWGRTIANQAHAEAIHDLVRYIASAGELPDQEADRGNLLIISPFRGQVALLRRTIDPALARRLTVTTVHRAQGTQARTVIFDLTVAGAAPAPPFATDHSPDGEGARLLATAFTRARSRLIIIGSLEWAMHRAWRNGILRRVYAHLLAHAYQIPLQEFRDSRPKDTAA